MFKSCYLFIYLFSLLAPEVTTTEGKSIIEVTIIILDFLFLVCRCFFKSFTYFFSFLATEVTTTEGKSIIEVTVIILDFVVLSLLLFL